MIQLYTHTYILPLCILFPKFLVALNLYLLDTFYPVTLRNTYNLVVVPIVKEEGVLVFGSQVRRRTPTTYFVKSMGVA